MRHNIEGISRVEIAAFIGFGMIFTVLLITLMVALVCFFQCQPPDDVNSQIIDWANRN